MGEDKKPRKCCPRWRRCTCLLYCDCRCRKCYCEYQLAKVIYSGIV